MLTAAASPSEWKILLQTMQSFKEILNVCRPHPQLRAPFEVTAGQAVCTLLEKIVSIIDLSSTSSHKRFIVRQGNQAWLDECEFDLNIPVFVPSPLRLIS